MKPIRLRLAAGVLLVAGVVAGCSDDTPDTASTASTAPGDPTPTETAPGDLPPLWEPTIPEQPVDPASVRTSYDAVLDAAVAVTAGDQTWGRTTTLTEQYDGICAVRIQRVATGAPDPDLDALRTSLGAAVTGLGFADLDAANDPGGAVLFVAHDDADAFLEWRSKGETTVAVRVATAATECPA